jgi:hypothetical protein
MEQYLRKASEATVPAEQQRFPLLSGSMLESGTKINLCPILAANTLFVRDDPRLSPVEHALSQRLQTG